MSIPVGILADVVLFSFRIAIGVIFCLMLTSRILFFFFFINILNLHYKENSL